MPRLSSRNRKQRMRKRKGRKSSGYALMVNPEHSLVPYRFRTTATFVETWENTTGAPGFYDWVLRGNSIYDPDYALSGSGVAGLVAMAGIYTQYKVLSSRILVSVTNNDADDPVYLVILPTGYSASFAVAHADAILGNPHAKHMAISNDDGVKTLSHKAASNIMFDVKDLDSVNFRADLTTNPASVWYWHVVTYNRAGNASDCEMRVQVEYDVEFSTPVYFT